MSTVQKTMDAVITTGEYTDNQGNLKKKYMNIGTLFVYQDGGLSLKLDAMPIGGGNISFYDRKPKQQQQPQQQGYSTSNGTNNPSPVQQQGYNQQQNPPAAQHLPQQNQNTMPQQQVPGTQIPLEVDNMEIPFNQGNTQPIYNV